jgi:hypothetical protein
LTSEEESADASVAQTPASITDAEELGAADADTETAGASTTVASVEGDFEVSQATSARTTAAEIMYLSIVFLVVKCEP